MKTPRSYAIHIALDKYDTTKYGGKDGHIGNPQNDGRAYLEIAHREGYQHNVALFGHAATSTRMKRELAMAADILNKEGGQLFLSFSGHGAKLASGGEEEADGQDEGLCLYNGCFIDNSFRLQLAQFSNKVTILLVANCCFSGGVTKPIKKRPTPQMNSGSKGMVPKAIAKLDAQLLLLAAASEKHMADAGTEQSDFTSRIKEHWEKGELTSYPALVAKANKGKTKSKCMLLYLDDCTDNAFIHSPPFKIVTNINQ